MKVTKTTRIHSITLALSFPLVLMLFAADAECAQARQKSSEELLLEIMDLHSELVTDETFLAQAKMLGAYLEAAQPLEEAKKIKIYAKVLNILAKIKDLADWIPPSPPKPQSDAEQISPERELEERKTVYEPGAALLEIFKIDPDRKEIPDLPVIRTYWKRDLAYSGSFLLPDRFSEIGRESFYAARFSFYYEAKESGKYGFTVLHEGKRNGCKLTIGGIDVVKVDRQPVGQGVCNLKKGFHRVEFWLGSTAMESSSRSYTSGYKNNATFQVKILTPDAFDAVSLTKNMMLLKKE